MVSTMDMNAKYIDHPYGQYMDIYMNVFMGNYMDIFMDVFMNIVAFKQTHK